MTSGFSYAHLATKGARPAQEDSCAFAASSEAGEPRQLLAVLADGMGGHVAGALASNVVCRRFLEAYTSSAGAPRLRLAGALDASNRALAEAVLRDRSLVGMGSTLIGAAFEVHEREAVVSWVSVGDSPLFLFRQSRLYQLNENHSLAPLLDQLVAAGEMTADEAASHPRRHYLRSALTGSGIELVDLSDSTLALAPGDWIIAASDGLETLPHAEIADILAFNCEASPATIAEALIASVEAAAEPNQDNATVMAIRPLE